LSVFLIIIYVISIFLITLTFQRFNNNNKELLRKIIHIGIGPLIPIAKYIGINQNTAQYVAGFIFLLVFINYIYKLFPIIEDVDRKSYGTLFYCLSFFTLISLFWDKEPESLIVGCFIMAFGDGFAGLIGKSFKSRSWKVFNQKKSLLGTSTMFLISFSIILIMSFISNYQFTFNYILLALIATCLEQFSFIGIDNLIVPTISAFLYSYLIAI